MVICLGVERMNIVPLTKSPTKKEAQAIIRKLVELDQVRFHPHALRRKRKRHISDMQILNCLLTGYVAEEPVQNLSHQGWETAVVGKVTGETLRVAVCIRWKQDVLVITCYFE